MKVVIKLNYSILLVVFIMITYTQSCSNSPRYNRNKPKPHISKTKPKLNKNQKVFYGTSSYYGKDFHGKLTANGEVFDMYGLTAAHKTLALNTIIRVTNKSNDKSLILRVNDRGPYVGNRILDCSYGAALKLDFLQQGTAEVKIEVIEWGDDKYMKHK